MVTNSRGRVSLRHGKEHDCLIDSKSHRTQALWGMVTFDLPFAISTYRRENCRIGWKPPFDRLHSAAVSVEMWFVAVTFIRTSNAY
jgi:hypothetical protein